MIASALPASSSGTSGGDDASGFQGLLSSLLSEGREGAADRPPTVGDGRWPDVSGRLTLTPTDKVIGSEPLVLPGAEDGKDGEPQVLPGELVAKDVDPQVLPGIEVVEELGPQVLPDSRPDKDAEPLVLPGAPAAKVGEPQVLPGPEKGKALRPQVLPETTPEAVAAPVPAGEDAVEAGLSGSATGSVRSGATAALTPPLTQAIPPPLRPLAERTSKPLEEGTPAAPRASQAVEPKGAGASPSPTTPADPAVKSAPLAAPTPPAPQADAATPLTEEARPSGGPVTAQAEAPAPARDHGLSPLSRAAIDATAQIAAQIMRKLEGRSTRFEIALRPAELGRVDVKLDIDSEGRLAARLAFDNPAAATDLRGRADELRRQLEAEGFQLADDAFEFAERDSGSNAFDRGQDARRGSNRAFAAATRLNAETDVAQPPQWLALSLSPSGVDMKV